MKRLAFDDAFEGITSRARARIRRFSGESSVLVNVVSRLLSTPLYRHQSKHVSGAGQCKHLGKKISGGEYVVDIVIRPRGSHVLRSLFSPTPSSLSRTVTRCTRKPGLIKRLIKSEKLAGCRLAAAEARVIKSADKNRPIPSARRFSKHTIENRIVRRR